MVSELGTISTNKERVENLGATCGDIQTKFDQMEVGGDDKLRQIEAVISWKFDILITRHESSLGNPNAQAAQSSNGKTQDEVLVRVYGSYNYLYVDLVKCCSELENILQQNNGSYKEIFNKSLEQDLLSTKSSRSKGHGSKSKESTEEAERNFFKNAWLQEKLVPNSPSTHKETKGKTPKQDAVQKKVESIKASRVNAVSKVQSYIAYFST